MTLEVETIVAVSLMMAVFAAVAAIGTSIVLGAGFERLRAGFEIVSRQTGFFSDAIYKLEKKVEVVDEQTGKFTRNINQLEAKVANVGEQANVFCSSIQKLEQKVDIVDRQSAFFSNELHKLEQQLDTAHAYEEIVSEKLETYADTDLISTGKAEALVSHAEDLLVQVSALASQLQEQKKAETQELHLSIPGNLSQHAFLTMPQEEIRYH